jgi:hypothetical protein
MVFERRCYRVGVGITAALFTCAFVVFVKTDFAYLKKVRVSNDAPGLSVSKGETFALDYRSTCHQCAQRLKAGDLITFVDEHQQNRIARVENLSTRTPASAGTAPEDMVEIRMNPDGGTRIKIPLSQVLGSMR